MKRTSVLYVSPVAERGGAETVLLNLLKWQDRSRFLPSVCLLKRGPLVEDVGRIVDDVHVFATPRLRSVATLSALTHMRRVICASRVDVVFGNMAMGQVYGSLAALGTPARAVWFQHGIVGRPDFVDRLAARLPAAVTFAPSRTAERAQAARSSRTPVRIIREGIDTSTFNPALWPRGVLRQSLGIDLTAPLFATVGRLQRGKGHSRFLDTALEISKTLPESHFVVVGGSLFGIESAYRAELQESADRRLPPGRVHFLGHRDDVPAVLADVDVLIQCPVAPESFGLAIVEAMAMRVPAVTIRAWGPAEIVDDGRTGVLVDQGEPQALAAAALALWHDPARRCAMGLAARRRVEDCFSVQRMVAEIETELERVAGAAA